MSGNFNPRPRKEGDPGLNIPPWRYAISIHALAKRATKHNIIVFIYHRISIHALAKRATGTASRTDISSAISIHALAKRATMMRYASIYLKVNFNPRPRKEGDHGLVIFCASI